MKTRAELGPESVPTLPRHIRLQWDKRRECWVLQAPERVIFPDEIATEVLQHCDGAATLAAIAATLAEKYEAPSAEIEADVTELLQDLADKGFVTA